MPQGFGLEPVTTTQVVAAYCAPQTMVDATLTADPPEWVVAGEFFLPLKVESCRLDIDGLVSASGLTLQARLFDMTAVSAITGSLVNITSVTPVRALSGSVELAGNRRYQIQVRAHGNAVGDDKFGHLLTATISD